MAEFTGKAKARTPHWYPLSRIRTFTPNRPDRAGELWQLWLERFDGDEAAALGALLEAAIAHHVVDVDPARRRWPA